MQQSAFADALSAAQCDEATGVCSIPDNINIEFIERVLKGLPSNIFLKDDQCRYVFATKYWAHIQHEGENWTIRGKTDFDIRNSRENAQKAFDEDQKILATGEGRTYTIKEIVDDSVEYLEIIKSPVFADDGSVIGIVGLINNVTEKELMRLELERFAVTDPMTGLLNRHRFSQLLSSGLTDDQCPAAIIMADCDRLKTINDLFGHACGNEFICQTADLLKKTLPQNALIFRTGGDVFVAFIPNITEEETNSLKKQLEKSQGTMNIHGQPLSVSVGFAMIDNQDEDIRNIIEQADFFMYEQKTVAHSRQEDIKFSMENICAHCQKAGAQHENAPLG